MANEMTSGTGRITRRGSMKLHKSPGSPSADDVVAAIRAVPEGEFFLLRWRVEDRPDMFTALHKRLVGDRAICLILRTGNPPAMPRDCLIVPDYEGPAREVIPLGPEKSAAYEMLMVHGKPHKARELIGDPWKDIRP